jgi:hypothetical protein
MKKIDFSLDRDKMLKFGIGTIGSIVAIMFFSFMHRMFVSPPIESVVVEDVGAKKELQTIQVSIFNACEVPGLAAKTREYLRQRGFDVVSISNYKEKLDKSIICDRMGSMDTAGKVAYAMGICDSLVVSKVDSGLFVHASIILGEDFFKLKPFN